MKAFTLYKTKNVEFKDNLHEEVIKEPVGLMWNTFGLIPSPTLYEDEAERMVSEPITKGRHLTVSIIERILPSASINREIAKIAARWEYEHNQKPNRAQKAQWKEAFIEEHLPNAPLKETRIDCWYDENNGDLLIGSSSARVAEAVVSYLLLHVFDEGVELKLFRPSDDAMHTWMKNCLMNEGLVSDSVKLKNRISDETISVTKAFDMEKARDVMRKSGDFNVIEIGCFGEGYGSFKLNDKAFVKGIKYANMQELSDEEYESRVSLAKAAAILELDALRQIVAVLQSIEGEDL